MTLAAYFDDGTGEDAVQVATTKGWVGFVDWAVKLDVEEFPELIHLAEHGWEEELPKLASQIESALKQHVPSLDIEHVAEGLLEAIRDNIKAGVITISDGTSGQGEPEED